MLARKGDTGTRALLGRVTRAATLGESLDGPQELTLELPWDQQFHSWECPTGPESRHLNIFVCSCNAHAHSSIIHSSQDMETTRVSSDRQNLAHAHNGTVFSHKERNSDTCCKADGPWQHHAEGNSQSEDKPCGGETQRQGGDGELVFSERRVSIWGDDNVLETVVVTAAQLCECH